MRRILHMFIALIIVALCCSCSSGILQSQNDKLISFAQPDINMMISAMPVFEDGDDVYFADNYKMLMVLKDGQYNVLDECLPQELITDIYVDDEYIFYIKYDIEKSNVMRISKDNFRNRNSLYEVSHSASVKFGLDYIYSDKSDIYYFNASTYTLYKFNDNEEKHIDNVTGAVISAGAIYYADKSRSIYMCDKDLKKAKLIWSAEMLEQTEDEALARWSSVNLTDIAEIQQMSIHNDRLFFTLSNTGMTPTRLLFSINTDGVDFQHYLDFVLYSYQWYDDELLISGRKASNPSSNGETFEYDTSGKITDFAINKKYTYLSDNYCYYWADEGKYQSLYRINLDSGDIENLNNT